MAEALARRREERDQLLALAREYVGRLSKRIGVLAAAVVGSVARGDFNVWSDVDIVVIAEALPQRVPDRSALLVADAPPRVQPVGFLPAEFRAAYRKGNPLAVEAITAGIVLSGDDELRRLAGAEGSAR